MSDFFEGTMAVRDYLANKNAVFRPAVNASDNNGAYAPPCLEIGGVQVYAYVRDGILVVSLHYDTADVSDQSPFAVYDGASIPTVIHGGLGEIVWDALPDDAVSEADARAIRKAHADEPEMWPSFALPDWVDGT